MELDADGDLVLARLRNLSPPDDAAHEGIHRGRAGTEELPLSEVHMGVLQPQPGSGTSGPAAATTFDTADGTLSLTLRHAMATPLRSVGLQIWRGALLLADLALHRGAAALSGAVALELGAGPGLAGLALSTVARAVVLTGTLSYVGAEVLANCALNAEHHLHQHGGKGIGGSGASGGPTPHVLVRSLDWLDPPDWLLAHPSPQAGAQLEAAEAAVSNPHAWQASDLHLLQGLDWILAADCVYDDRLTEAMMRTAVLLMRYARRHSGRSPQLLVAMERRVCFTMSDTPGVRAPAYDFWRTLFEAEEDEAEESSATAAAEAADSAARRAQAVPQAAAREPLFPLIGRRLDVAGVPQRLRSYERSEFLELWQLQLRE